MQHKNMRVIQALWHIEKWLKIMEHCILVSTLAFYSLFTFITNKNNNKILILLQSASLIFVTKY